MYDENQNIVALFSIKINDSYIEFLKNASTSIKADYNKRIDPTKILEKNNITNDNEWFEYITNYKITKNNIFSRVGKIKDDFTIQFITTIAYPQINHTTEINGDYTGYIFNNKNNCKEVLLIKNNKNYILNFCKENYFNDDYIKELLETIIIE